MQLHKAQVELTGKVIFIEKLDTVLCRDIPEFSELDAETRNEFLVACLYRANSRGLITEQGIAAYTLAACWLEIGFEEKSRYLMALLNSDFSELRKVYAMNEWVRAVIGDLNNIEAANEKVKEGFYRTQAWGRR